MNIQQLEKIKNLLVEIKKAIYEDNEDQNLNLLENSIEVDINDVFDFIDSFNAIGKYYKYTEGKETDYIYVKSYKPYKFKCNKIKLYESEAKVERDYYSYFDIRKYKEITKEEYDKALEQAKEIIDSLK